MLGFFRSSVHADSIMLEENLAIQEGVMAFPVYLRMIDSETSAIDRAKIRKNLLEYCGQDALAMVKIREELLDKTSNK